LCAENAKFCVCPECEKSLKNAPRRCLSCAVPLITGLSFCGACLSAAPRFSRAYTAFDYADSCARLIKQFKFDYQLCVGDFLAHKLYEKYLDILSHQGKYDAIIPMPLSSQRLRERGFNQAHELLRIIAKQTDAHIDIRLCRRIKATPPLSSLKLAQRKQAIKGAFRCQKSPYQNVLLVDDVMTTGSSLNELTKTLMKAGVKNCDVLTLARA
jgi:ComF family protein